MPDSLSNLIRTGVQDVNKTIGNEYATVTKVNNNNTVNLQLDSVKDDLNDLINIKLVSNLDITKGDKVIVTYLDNDSNKPVVMGMLNPQFNGSGENGRSIVSIDKVESEGFTDVYRITYDKFPIYSYFNVPNTGKLDLLVELLIEKDIITQSEWDNKINNI
jgi:translation initiation factor IF-1